YLFIIFHKDIPLEILNPDPTEIEVTDADGGMKQIKLKSEKGNIISLTQVLENGVYAMEFQLTKTQCGGCGTVGIVRDSYTINAGADLSNCPHRDHCAIFCGRNWHNGQTRYKGSNSSGNKGFADNQIVRLEFDSEKGTLIFFVDGAQQPVYISGIKEKVRFIIYMYHANSTGVIRSLKILAAPTSGHVANQKTVQW
ncbi:MAG: hypothetical protein EZS28_042204, partial [Streblomastix strix]